jgi:transcriptional regulator with XRE-family HTH domain
MFTSSRMLKKTYAKKGFTLRTLAKKVGRSFKTMSLYANGDHPIPEGVDKKIANLVFDSGAKKRYFLEQVAKDRNEHLKISGDVKKIKKCFTKIKNKYKVVLEPVITSKGGQFELCLGDLKVEIRVFKLLQDSEELILKIHCNGVLVPIVNGSFTRFSSQELKHFIDGKYPNLRFGLIEMVKESINRDPLGYLSSKNDNNLFLTDSAVQMIVMHLDWAKSFIQGDYEHLYKVFSITDQSVAKNGFDGKEDEMKFRLLHGFDFAKSFISDGMFSREQIDSLYKSLLNAVSKFSK